MWVGRWDNWNFLLFLLGVDIGATDLENSAQDPGNLNIYTFYDPEIPLQCVQPTEMSAIPTKRLA